MGALQDPGGGGWKWGNHGVGGRVALQQATEHFRVLGGIVGGWGVIVRKWVFKSDLGG